MTGTPFDNDADRAFRGSAPDATSLGALAEQGLRYSVIDPSDPAVALPWIRADYRGFLQASPTAERVEAERVGLAYRRFTGVYDDADATASERSPIATVSAWRSDLTLPGSTVEHPRTLPSWAISAVTVAPTHRRRGIARSLLEGELRTAVANGLAMAMLTVSESTIYGRFGFAPAAFAAHWTIDTRRVRWSGPAPSGRVEFVTLAEYREQLPALRDRLRLQSPGEIEGWSFRWDQLVGANEPESDRTKSLRAVRCLDDEGLLRGLALFHYSGGDDDFAQHTVTVDRLDAETPDADLALWRFLLELDLTSELRAELRHVEEPMRWRIGDFRAAKVSVWEHQYLRVLDVPRVLEARGYLSDGELVLQVADQLGFAAGTWLLSVAPDGSAHVTSVTSVPPATPALALTANELAAVYLGGVSVATLVDAGRITELTPGAALAADALLRSDRAPWLSIWY